MLLRMVIRQVTFCLLLASAAAAQRITPPTDVKARTAAIFARYNRTDTPGCAVAAGVDGATVLSAGYGMADLEHSIAITPDSVFEAGSVSKQFTAFAVLLLAQQGKLALDDSIRKYLPELPEYLAPVTIRHLLTHTSGLRDWGSIEAIAGWPRTTRVYTHAHVLEILSRQNALNYPPGTTYSYTNSGYSLSAILVAKLSGKSYAAFSKEAIFTPLGLTSTEWRDDFRRIVRNRAIAYNDSGSTIRQEMPFEDTYGHGGLLTTVADLLRWNQNFADAKVGGRALIQEQQEPAKLNTGQPISYALGLNVGKYRGMQEVSHSGATAAYRAWLARYPDQGLSVAVLCNASSANATSLGRQVTEMLVGPFVTSGPSSAPPAAKSAAADNARLAMYTGMYRSSRAHDVVLVDLREGQLRSGSRVLRPVENNVFEVADGRVTFEVDRSGNVRRMRLPGAIDPTDYYEKVERAAPTGVELQAYAGEYVSDEAEVVYKLAVEGDSLVLRRRPDTHISLSPTYRDAFTYQGNTLRFMRDAAGNVNELSVSEDRVWDLRFRKVK